MLKTAVVGASGYAGGELLRLIQGHPNLSLSYAAANTQSGAVINALFPNLQSIDGKFVSFDKINWDQVDAVFFALPHGESSKLIPKVPEHILIVDLGADFRLENETDWLNFYGTPYAGSWTYGLSDIELNQSKIRGVRQVANPGCYATAISLSLAPFVSSELVNSESISVVAASGTSGAGRKPVGSLLSAENMNNISAYKVGGVHQHIPEIEQFLNSLSAKKVSIGFTPILAPMPRGILAVANAELAQGSDLEELRAIFSAFYKNNPFIKLLDGISQPQTKAVQFSNSAHFQIQIDQRRNQLIITSVIDNLIKGAAGQAIQNLNLMAGFEVSAGLAVEGMHP
jgi:N-acetyl-gamma-glutamyl-phosphate reductase